jgi:protein phosphatase
MFGKRSNTTIVRSAAPLTIGGTMLTHPGCLRDLNEDVVSYTLPSTANPTAQDALAIVADGMGGHAAGEVASRMAADTVSRLYYEGGGSPADRLTAAFAAANKAIYHRSKTDPACAGMGTTCTALAIQGGTAFLAHIGDSRAYLLREGHLSQISEDHSLVAELVREGRLTAEEAAISPDRNIVLRGLGIEVKAKPAVWREGMPLREGDVLVLCSDGLTDVVPDDSIGKITGSLPPFEACQALIDAALAAGGPDNVSVGAFLVGTGRARSQGARTTRPLPHPKNGGGA